MSATRAAVEEGIVSGGGTALVNLIPALEKAIETAADDLKLGMSIVLRSLTAPLKQIAENAGREGSVVVEKVKTEKQGTGYDARRDQYVDMISQGIVDPAKVTIAVVESAASIASLAMTTETLVADEEEKPAPAAPDMAWVVWVEWRLISYIILDFIQSIKGQLILALFLLI